MVAHCGLEPCPEGDTVAGLMRVGGVGHARGKRYEDEYIQPVPEIKRIAAV